MTPTIAAIVSLLGGLGVFALKWLAWTVTDSVALYSDALETVVNVAAALALLGAVRIARRPADEGHPFGHFKAEYFAVAFEGVLVVAAAVAIAVEAWERFHVPAPITSPGVGTAIAVAAAVANAALATFLIRVGRATRSPALVADGQHLWTDVVTTAGALTGMGLATLTDTPWLDPAAALVVAGHILVVGGRLISESVGGLMDASLSPEETERLHATLEAHRGDSLEIHDIRARRAGQRIFVQAHLVVRGAMPVAEAHAICDALEAAVQDELPGADVTIHVEPEHEAEARAEPQ